MKIELTDHCERMCIHCSSEAKTEGIHELPLETVKRIIAAPALYSCYFTVCGFKYRF